MKKYLCLNNQEYLIKEFKIVPIRFQDRLDIMKWRNEQTYHLRQSHLLTIQDQESYFRNVVEPLFIHEQPNQLLFSFLKNDKCIGYGGLVHINWIDMNAEISFLMDTKLEKEHFQVLWSNFLNLIESVAFDDLKFHKIYTYAYDIRPQLFKLLNDCKYTKEAVLREHVYINGVFENVLIHSKFNYYL
jgi:RimJ/RimL family protein N-acetyltransferase